MFSRLSELTALAAMVAEAKHVRREGDLADLIEKYLDKNKMYHLEGERGVRNFVKLVRVLDSQYDSMESFLYDNSGAIEAMVEWLSSMRNSEWVSNMQDATHDDSGDEDKDEDEDADEDEDDLSSLIEKFCDQRKLYNLEGERGVRNFVKIVSALDSQYSSLDEFLYDNSGALQAMIEWLGSMRNSEWVSNMQDAVSATNA
jgi:hypothetical protein